MLVIRLFGNGRLSSPAFDSYGSNANDTMPRIGNG